jgi:hypothetical protein
MDAQLKEDLRKFMWPMIEVVIILMIILLLVFTRALNTTALDKVEELEKRVETQEKMINFLVSVDKTQPTKNDTIVVNVNEKFNVRVKLEQ